MAQGDKWFDCTNPKKILSIEQTLKLLIYDDGAGNPVLHTDPAGTALEPYFNCAERKVLSMEHVLRDMILEDADGNPYLNTTS